MAYLLWQDAIAVKSKITLESCEFQIKAKKDNNEYTITKHIEHKACCGNNLILKHNRTYNAEIEGVAVEFISNKVTCTVNDLRSYIKGANKIDLNWSQGFYYRNKAHQRLGLDEITSFKELENYFNILREVYIGSNCTLVVNSGEFVCCFVSLVPWIYLFLGSKRQMITLDATFLTGKRGGACLVAVFMDSGGKIIPLGIGLYETEEAATWKHFLECLKQAIPELDVYL